MRINGIETKAQEFAFDGCHKFYLIEDSSEKQEAERNGYGIFPINELPKMFDASCPLRFIDTWKLDSVVPQCEEKVLFEWEGGEFLFDVNVEGGQ